MTLDDFRIFRARMAKSMVAVLAGLCLAVPFVYAQEEDEEDATAASSADEVVEEITVTGSRLKRDTYTSISPLQVITGQISREIGLVDAAKILQESTVASGVQADLTFGGFGIDNGPGSTAVDLRGLGQSRTLFLVNGRRLAPSGVEGSPTSPDIGLIPGSLVQQYEVLLDGASSVYGSDAVAGVVNVILRKDFDGLEVEAFSSIPAAGSSAGLQNSFSAAWGYNGDRGFIGIAAEYADIEKITRADRDWTDQCESHAEITTDGEIRTTDLYYSTFLGQESPGDCKITGLAGYVTELGSPPIGTMLYEPGFSSMGIPNLSDYYDGLFGVPVDTLGRGVTDVSFADHNLNGNSQFVDMIPDIQTTAVMAYGEYTFEGEANLTPYFELQYNRRESQQVPFVAQLFPTVNALNPYNPCNPAAIGGVDCGEAWDSLLDDPNHAANVAAVYGLTPAEFRDFGIFDAYSGPAGPIAVQPVVAVRGDRNNTDVDLGQIRAVAGLRGDLPFINFGSVDNWAFDFYVTNTVSDGDSVRVGVIEDRLDLAPGNYSDTGAPCENDTNIELPADTQGCVPVNMFADSLFANPTQNDFATSAERDYLFGNREFTTKYRQTVASYYMNGDIFELPGGDALFGLGVEYREDEIESIPNDVAAEGRFFGFSSDEGALGEKSTREFFAELELPLLANINGVKELTVNGSTRYTKDEFYEGSWTYSGKLAYRPVDSFLFRATVGTSYRAPNMRENFLANQTGFRNLTDPCVVPDDAFDPLGGGYDPDLDKRTDEVIANCIADPNVDPFTFTNNGIQTYSTEVKSGGALDLVEEKSDTWSTGIVWEQPFFSSFDLVFGATYYEIEVRDEIIEPNSIFIVSDCYNDLQGDSFYCSRITRDPTTSQFQLVDEGFINRDVLKARGLDVNLTIDIPTQMFGRAVDLAADFTFNRNYETSSRVLAGEDEIDDFKGEFGYPTWKGRSTFRADVGDFRYTWSVRYISSVEQDPDGIGEFSNIYDDVEIDTCEGPDFGDVNCRNIGYAENYFVHDASAYYYADNWTFGLGVRNIFNEAPPFVDGGEVSSNNNVPRGAGYDLFGRTAFLNAVYNWQ